MASLAELPDLVGFFSYSRDDDKHSGGALSLLRERISNELRLQLGRKLRLWQDIEAIPLGTLWEGEIRKAIAESAFFIPIVSPSALKSSFCRMEFEAFLARERELDRNDLVFPILYIPVPALASADQRGRDEALKIIHARQYADWTEIRLKDAASIEVKTEVAHFCRAIVEALHGPAGSVDAYPERIKNQLDGVASFETWAPIVRFCRHMWEVLRKALRRYREERARRRKEEEARRGEEARAREEQERFRKAVEAKTSWQVETAPSERGKKPLSFGQKLALVFWSVFLLFVVLLGNTHNSPLSPERERALKPTNSFKECDDCPEMVVVPAGSFRMGSPPGEVGREPDEGPQHDVTIGKPFAVGKLHVTVDQFAAFVRETGYEASTKCWAFEGGYWAPRADRSWRNPGFAQEGSHPAVCLRWKDANAYVDWLAKKTGKPYRLLTEAEWEYASRGRTLPGAYPRFWFGDDEKDLCLYGNGADRQARDSIEGMKDRTVAPCNDGHAYTSPAGHYRPNVFGLYDMFGNAWQWTVDCWHSSYNGAPADGSAWTNGCLEGGRVIRGGSWYYDPGNLRSAERGSSSDENSNIGFRLARTLTP